MLDLVESDLWKKNEESLSFGCFVAPDLRKDIHVWPYSFLSLQTTRANIRPQEKWAVNLMIVDDHFNFHQSLCRYVWVNLIYHLWGYKKEEKVVRVEIA